MSVLTTISNLNLMSEPTPKEDEDTTGNFKNMETKKPESKLPARIKGTRTFSAPFSREVYGLFVSSLKNGEHSYPSSRHLRAIGFPNGPSVAPRQKFRQMLPRLDLATVDGPLMFSANHTEDALISKRTRKIIVPVEDAEMVVRRAHLTGRNRQGPQGDEFEEETKRKVNRKHRSYTKTVMVLSKDFAVNRREFGIDKLLIRRIVDNCRSCALAEISSEDDTPAYVENQEILSNGIACGKSVVVSKPDPGQQVLPSRCEPHRFSSMIAHIPDKHCIWYDRQTIANTANRYSKLLLVLNEIKGDMALAIRGHQDAKQRVETKMYCCQLLIKDYIKSLNQSVNGDSDLEITTQFVSLQKEYQEANQSSIFDVDLQNVLTSVQNNTLIIPQLVVTQIEDYLNPTTDAITS